MSETYLGKVLGREARCCVCWICRVAGAVWEAKDNIDMEERLEWNVIGRQPFQSICVSGLIFEIFGSV